MRKAGLAGVAMPAGVVSLQVDLKENYRRMKRKGGGLLLAAETKGRRQVAAGIDAPPSKDAINDNSAVLLDEPETYRAHLLEDSTAKATVSHGRRPGLDRATSPIHLEATK